MFDFDILLFKLSNIIYVLHDYYVNYYYNSILVMFLCIHCLC